MPGMVYNFIYDEFHPDAVYDNTMLVEDDLLRDIFGKNELFFRVHYAKDGFLFNGHIYTDWSDYEMKVQRFKSLFDEIALEQSAVSSCLVDGNRCLVTGEYKAVGVTGGQRSIFQGSFTVKLEKGYLDYWEFIEINLAGFSIE